jgi:hypothetical protein
MSRKKKEREREKIPFIVATYVYASSQVQRTHSAWTNVIIHCLTKIIKLWHKLDQTKKPHYTVGRPFSSATAFVFIVQLLCIQQFNSYDI